MEYVKTMAGAVPVLSRRPLSNYMPELAVAIVQVMERAEKYHYFLSELMALLDTVRAFPAALQPMSRTQRVLRLLADPVLVAGRLLEFHDAPKKSRYEKTKRVVLTHNGSLPPMEDAPEYMRAAAEGSTALHAGFTQTPHLGFAGGASALLSTERPSPVYADLPRNVGAAPLSPEDFAGLAGRMFALERDRAADRERLKALETVLLEGGAPAPVAASDPIDAKNILRSLARIDARLNGITTRLLYSKSVLSEKDARAMQDKDLADQAASRAPDRAPPAIDYGDDDHEEHGED